MVTLIRSPVSLPPKLTNQRQMIRRKDGVRQGNVSRYFFMRGQGDDLLEFNLITLHHDMVQLALEAGNKVSVVDILADVLESDGII